MPLFLPQSFNTYRVLGIDPGLNNIGIALFDLRYSDNVILNINAFTLINDKLKDNTSLDRDMYSDRVVKLCKLRDAIHYVMGIYNPCLAVCESPFYSSFRPTAYAALVETIRVIHSAIMDYNTGVSFNTIEPLLVKKTVGAGMQKGKADVKEVIMANQVILNVLSSDINKLDEHAIDAIAIGYSFLKLQGLKLC